jgi:LacI family transcriptional regulator
VAIRLKDIARDLGVSVMTVSKVLRNQQDISTETRSRVLKRIKELNYEPNLAARALVTGRSHLVGLVVPDLVHPFFAQIAKDISMVLRLKEFGLVIASSEEDPELERQEIRQMLARRLDALIIASTQWTVESFRSIEEQRRPYVLVDRKFSGLPANFVGTDDLAVGRLATEHLIEIGCRRIAYVGGDYVSTAIERVQGYRGALGLAGLPASNQYILCRPHSDDAGDVTGYRAAKELLALPLIPDGIFCNNDPMALGVMEAVLEAGLRIPEDICIIGAGNVRYASALRVPLSSIDQNIAQLGKRSAELALSLMQAKTTPRPEQVVIQPKLIIRESTNRGAVKT